MGAGNASLRGAGIHLLSTERMQHREVSGVAGAKWGLCLKNK